MLRFRKKPVVIEAWRFHGLDRLEGMPGWVAGASQDRAGSDGLFIQTLEGVMEARPGDWIIQGVKNEVYPCRDDVFAATYERV